MKKIVTLLSVSAILSLAAFGAAPEGQWSIEGSDKTAPRKLAIHIDGNRVTGTLDGATITGSGVAGPYFWFHVVRQGGDSLYKGQMKDGKIELRESSPGIHRTLRFTKAQ